MPRKCVLIVDDDPQIIELLHETFILEGWKVYTAMDGRKALTIAEEESLDLIILDLLLPKIDGPEVCRRIREWSKVPIIVLSALKEPEEKIDLLNLGADDYMVKPFNSDELLARVEAVRRRSKTEDIINGQPYYNDGYLKCDFTNRQVTIANKEVRLTPTEYTILRDLISNSGKVIGYNQILASVWGTNYQNAREYLHDYVNRLRKKIEPDPAEPRYIINVPRVGYRFVAKR